MTKSRVHSRRGWIGSVLVVIAGALGCEPSTTLFSDASTTPTDTVTTTDRAAPIDATTPTDAVTDRGAAQDTPTARDAVTPLDVPVLQDVVSQGDRPTGSDAGTADVPVARDIPLAADAAGGCAVRLGTSESAAGQVGGNGGSPSMDLVCPSGAQAVGVAVRVSDGPTSAGNRRSAVGLAVLCATVRFVDGAPQVGTETQVEVEGSGAFGWSPATWTAPARCPPGWVVSGLQASRGTNTELFLDVTVTCAELRANGTPTGMTRALYVEGSLREDPVYDTVMCPMGQVVRRLGTRTGAGFDGVTLYCAAPECAP